MKVWVDADACPSQIRDLILRTASRRSVLTIFVANAASSVPETEYVKFVLVPSTPDAADAYIEEKAERGDIAITQDIPLASLLVPKGVTVMSPRGDSYNEANISDRLSTRDLMTELRDLGSVSGGPRPFDETLKRKFANLFDAAVTKGLTRR